MNIAQHAVGAAVHPNQGILLAGQKDSLLSPSNPTPFASVVEAIFAQTEDLGSKAQTALTGLLSGQGVEVHDVAIASQKAGAAFELALQVRNKAVAAYQQMMGMQF